MESAGFKIFGDGGEIFLDFIVNFMIFGSHFIGDLHASSGIIFINVLAFFAY